MIMNQKVKQIISGEEWYLFKADYSYDGAKWSVDIWAVSQEDAEKRIRAIRQTCVEVFRVYQVIECHRRLSWLVGLYIQVQVWWRNFLGVKS